jgi:transcriptional regulator with XRE-family HTH domain
MGKASRQRPARLAEKLLQIRVSLGLSQSEMVRRMGLANEFSRNYISAFELGTREPPLPILLKYAQAAGVCVDVLINDELDLPAKLPSSPKHDRSKPISITSRKKAR